MKKISAGKEAATPGTVSPTGSSKTVQVPEDTAAPTIENVTGKTEIKQTEDLIVTADANDNLSVKTVALYYKNNEKTEYKKVLLQQDYNDLALSFYDLFTRSDCQRKSIEYYYVVSDGTNEVKSDTIPSRLRMKRIRIA